MESLAMRNIVGLLHWYLNIGIIIISIKAYPKNPAKAVTQNIPSPALMCLPSRSSSVKVVFQSAARECETS